MTYKLFNYKINSSKQIMERQEFLTDLQESVNGTETRTQIRKYPILTCKYTVMANKADAERLTSEIETYKDKWLIPMYQHGRSALYHKAVNLTAKRGWVINSSYIVEVDKFGTITDKGIWTGGKITASASAVAVIPAFTGRIKGNTKWEEITGELVSCEITFEFDTYKELPFLIDSILTFGHNWKNVVDNDREQKEFGFFTGIADSMRVKYLKNTKTINITLFDKAITSITKPEINIYSIIEAIATSVINPLDYWPEFDWNTFDYETLTGFSQQAIQDMTAYLESITQPIIWNDGKDEILYFRWWLGKVKGRCNPFQWKDKHEELPHLYRLAQDTIEINYLSNNIANVKLSLVKIG